MEQRNVVRYAAPDGATLRAEVDEAGVHLSMTTRGEVVSLLLTPEDFDDFCNEVMALIYGP